MMRMNNPQQWPHTFDQDGNVVTQQEVLQEHAKLNNEYLQEHAKLNNEYLESKRTEFEEALADRCRKDDEVFNKMGFQEQVGAICYQVGMIVYALIADHNGVHARQVGQIG